jgi:hypothetical protein
VGVRVKVIDKGYNNFVAEAKKLGNNPKTKVGVLEGGPAREDGKDNVDIMMINEFGVGVPQRSIIRAGTDSNIDAIFRKEVHEYDKIIAGKNNVDTMLSETGEFVKKKFVQRFSKQFLLPNAPATVAAKGSDIPLVDTGELRESINYKVEK